VDYLVYFLTNSEGKYIKIGYTKRKDLNIRIKELSTGSSSPLSILGLIKSGDINLEKQLHKQFRQINLEWHEATNELLTYINKNNDLDVYVDWLDNKLIAYNKMKL
jgi:hypothetical protein